MAHWGHPTEIQRLPGQITSSCWGHPIFPQAIASPSNWANSVDWPAIILLYFISLAGTNESVRLGISNCIIVSISIPDCSTSTKYLRRYQQVCSLPCPEGGRKCLSHTTIRQSITLNRGGRSCANTKFGLEIRF